MHGLRCGQEHHTSALPLLWGGGRILGLCSLWRSLISSKKFWHSLLEVRVQRCAAVDHISGRTPESPIPPTMAVPGWHRREPGAGAEGDLCLRAGACGVKQSHSVIGQERSEARASRAGGRQHLPCGLHRHAGPAMASPQGLAPSTPSKPSLQHRGD